MQVLSTTRSTHLGTISQLAQCGWLRAVCCQCLVLEQIAVNQIQSACIAGARHAALLSTSQDANHAAPAYEYSHYCICVGCWSDNCPIVKRMHVGAGHAVPQWSESRCR